MFSYEERLKAVQLLIKYDMSYSTVMRELGYPTYDSLKSWYKEYLKNDNKVKAITTRKKKFTEAEKITAVNYYLEHGKCVRRTVNVLGYPSRPTLDKWVNELTTEKKNDCYLGKPLVKFTKAQKEQAVISLCLRNKPAREVASDLGVTRSKLYNWKRQFLNKDCEKIMKKKIKDKNVNLSKTEIDDLNEEKGSLQNQIEELQKEISHLQLEKEILIIAADVIKKDKGINLETLPNREKTVIINALRNKTSLKVLLKILKIAKSSYSYQNNCLNRDDKYADIRKTLKIISDESLNSYGYRRLHSVLRTNGRTISEKVVRRIMKEEDIKVLNIKRKKYSSYKGEISPEVENIINRDFKADLPNQKWLTDITEFSIPAGKIYLSPIIDCFDGLPVSWTIGTSPNAELVNKMLDEAISVLKENEYPMIHSDRGSHYRWPGWIDRMETAKLTRSMSKKGCSPDNSACEGFFGRIKNEMFYGRSWRGITINQFIEHLDRYLKWYASKRIKLSLGGMSPVDYRISLGLMA